MSRRYLQFEEFRLDVSSGELFRNDRAVRLPPQPTKLLLLLTRSPGALVTHEEIQRELWGEDTFVDFEQAVKRCVKQVRAALGDDAETPVYIETVPRRGYRFIGPLRDPAEGPRGESPGSPGVWSGRTGVLLASVIGIAALVVGSWTARHTGGGSSPLVSVAVLPFANLTGDPEQQHFADALHDAVIAELAQLRELTVISRQSVLRYRESRQSIPEIAQELGVEAVVEGSVFRSGNTVRARVQLIQALPMERPLWAGVFQRDLREILTLHGEVARGIAEGFPLAASPEELARLNRARTVNPAAYETWLHGWVERNRLTPESLERCIAFARESVAIDTEYGPAYALAAECNILSYWFTGRSPSEVFPDAKAAAQRAIAVDGSLGKAHGLLAFSVAAFDWDWARAERSFRRALDLLPGDAETHSYYSFFLNWLGRHEEAIEHARRAEQLSPGLPHPMAMVAAALVFARRYDEAIAQAQRTVELLPEYGFGYMWLALAYDRKGMYREGRVAQERAVRLVGETVAGQRSILGRLYVRTGDREAALRILDDMLRTERTTYVAPAQLAYLLMELGEFDEAIEWLERGYDVRDAEMPFLNTYPVFDPLRDDPRFQDLVSRMNFPD